MTVEGLAATIRAVDALLTLLANAGITVERVRAMRASNADGHLSDAQVDELAASAADSIARLRPPA